MDSFGYVRYFAFVVEGKGGGSSAYHEELLRSHRGKRRGGQGRGAIRTDCQSNRSCLVDGLGDVRYIAFVVEGDEDGSGIMESCFIVIVVNDVGGQGRWGDQN